MYELIVGTALLSSIVGFFTGFLVNAKIEQEKEAARRSSTIATKQKKK